MAAALIVVLVVARISVAWGGPLPAGVFELVELVAGDALLATMFALLALAMRRVRGGRHMTSALYWAIVAFTALNVPVAHVLSSPLTVPMLRAARGPLTDSILVYLSASRLAPMFAVVGTAWAMARVFRPMPDRWRLIIPGAAAAAVAATAALLPGDDPGVHGHNAMITFARSALPHIKARAGDADWTRPPLPGSPLGDDMTSWRGLAAGRNVVMVVLESTGAPHLRLYGGAYDLTPRLDGLARSALVFENAYAVTPESIRGLFSVLCSQYPAFDITPAEYGRAVCTSISARLSSAGYHTGLFHSGRFAYLGMEDVLRTKGFGTLEDAGAIGGQRESSFGVDEDATVQRMLGWVDSLAPGVPFFLTYMPIAGHHPYATPMPGPLPAHDEQAQYLNALHYGDQALGALIDGFNARGLGDRTMWIVFGDHGEAFGRHEGNFGHTFFLYEENVRVPFLVAVPGPIAETHRSRTIVSLVDVAPTMLDLLGIDAPPALQGHSALEERRRLALFFTDYTRGLVGLRDGPWKFVHDLGADRSELYNLEDDPGERRNLAPADPLRATSYAQRLTAWSAAQKARLRGAGDARPAP